MTTEQIDKRIQEASRAYSYWLDYTTPLGSVCDKNISEARENMIYWRQRKNTNLTN